MQWNGGAEWSSAVSWTAVSDLRMTAYQGGRVIDATSFANHGDLLGKISPQQGYLGFQGDDAQVELVARDESLARFAALRVQALVRPQPITRRFNIAEGWMSFALVIESDGRLHGTVFDGHKWVGPDSGAARVPPNQWSRVTFEFDGVSIATLTLDGATVGTRLDMPVGMHQPRQVITIGHWPRGDHRYTFKGEIGHVRIERRDHQDVFMDAVETAFCKRRLSSAQVDARREMAYLFGTLSALERQALRDCAKAQYEEMARFIHELRGLGGRETVRLRQLGNALRAAWCCSLDIGAARDALTAYLRSVAGQPDTPERERFLDFVHRFIAISHRCERHGSPYDRMNALNAALFPELADFEMALIQLVEDL